MLLHVELGIIDLIADFLGRELILIEDVMVAQLVGRADHGNIGVIKCLIEIVEHIVIILIYGLVAVGEDDFGILWILCGVFQDFLFEIGLVFGID